MDDSNYAYFRFAKEQWVYGATDQTPFDTDADGNPLVHPDGVVVAHVIPAGAVLRVVERDDTTNWATLRVPTRTPMHMDWPTDDELIGRFVSKDEAGLSEEEEPHVSLEAIDNSTFNKRFPAPYGQ